MLQVLVLDGFYPHTASPKSVFYSIRLHPLEDTGSYILCLWLMTPSDCSKVVQKSHRSRKQCADARIVVFNSSTSNFSHFCRNPQVPPFDGVIPPDVIPNSYCYWMVLLSPVVCEGFWPRTRQAAGSPSCRRSFGHWNLPFGGWGNLRWWCWWKLVDLGHETCFVCCPRTYGNVIFKSNIS